MGRTSSFIAGFEKAAAAFKLTLPSPKAFAAAPKVTPGFTPKNVKIAPTNVAPTSSAKPVGSYGVPTRATTRTPLSTITPQVMTTKKPRFTRKKNVDVVKVNKQPTSTGAGGPAAVTTAPKTPPAAAPTQTAPAQTGPSFMQRVRSSINSPGNKAMTYGGGAVVAGGLGLYGIHRGLESTIGPSRTQNDW